MKYPKGLGTQHGNHAKNKNGLLFFFFQRFWVKEPRHAEKIFAKKRYASILACVELSELCYKA